MGYSLKELWKLAPYVNEYLFSAYLFAFSISIAMIFGTQLMYLFVFGLNGLLGIFGGNAFKFLEVQVA